MRNYVASGCEYALRGENVIAYLLLFYKEIKKKINQSPANVSLDPERLAECHVYFSKGSQSAHQVWTVVAVQRVLHNQPQPVTDINANN